MDMVKVAANILNKSAIPEDQITGPVLSMPNTVQVHRDHKMLSKYCMMYCYYYNNEFVDMIVRWSMLKMTLGISWAADRLRLCALNREWTLVAELDL